MRIKIKSKAISGKTSITQEASIVWANDHHVVQVDGKLWFAVTDEQMSRLHAGEKVSIMWMCCDHELAKDDYYERLRKELAEWQSLDKMRNREYPQVYFD